MKRAAIGVALATAAALASGCRAGAQADPLPAFTPAADARYEVVASADLKWEQLNPARGDASPRAATLWGDRQGNEPTGFLLNPAEGFRSPPHAHNVSYRALVLRGQLHNDDPQAEDQWLPPGSYWTQPKGGVHVTAAKGGQALAYVEIESGPYRVIPPEQAFAAEEAPVNVDAANLVWLEASSVAWLDPSGRLAAEVAFLWGRPNSDQLSGALLRLPKGFGRWRGSCRLGGRGR